MRESRSLVEREVRGAEWSTVCGEKGEKSSAAHCSAKIVEEVSCSESVLAKRSDRGTG